MKAIFLSRVINTVIGGSHPFVVQIFKGESVKNARDDDLWEIVFAGTQEECKRYEINMHHSINPDMATATTVYNPKRIIEP